MEEVPETISSAEVSFAEEGFEIDTPSESGAYRLYVYADNDQGYTAHANIPFFVKKRWYDFLRA